MSNLGYILLSAHVLYVTLIVSAFFVIVLSEEDELHQYAINRALKISVVITVLSLLGYAFYMLVYGNKFISIHVLFFAIEGLGILTLLFYFLELKGLSLSFKIKNKKSVKFICAISTSISILSTISMAFKLKWFANPTGLIRYDELLLYVNIIFLCLFTPFFPNAKQKIDRESYKIREKKIKKSINIFTIIYILFMLALISYVVYRKVIL